MSFRCKSAASKGLAIAALSISAFSSAFASNDLDFSTRLRLQPPPPQTQPGLQISPRSRIFLMAVDTNAQPGLHCDLEVTADSQNVLTGAIYTCNQGQKAPRVFSIEELKSGVVLFRDEERDLNVVSVSAPLAEPIQGGSVLVSYLHNGMKKEYRQWTFEVANTGKSWLAYTARDAGRAPFNRMFLQKKTFLGKTIGIESINASWVNQTQSLSASSNLLF